MEYSGYVYHPSITSGRRPWWKFWEPHLPDGIEYVPVQGATVCLYDYGTCTPVRAETTTDSEGRWSINYEGHDHWAKDYSGPRTFHAIIQVGARVGPPAMFLKPELLEISNG